VPFPLPTKLGASHELALETVFFDNLKRGKYPAIDEIPTSAIKIPHLFDNLRDIYSKL
jgi:hypothetical protein